ncbi:MAG: serine/threonine protein kinase [Vicinamibacteria bacterium]|nr:serine/threonine protein kinase [Vicinamibacteria bacterium]MBP9947624.1 serine/threonine protein kinase [Vicinamibacteria bacterium]
MPSKYVLEQELGAGGMGRVYRARLVGEAGFERPVVIKKLLDGTDLGLISLFVEEARRYAVLDHENIGRIFDFERIDNDLCIVLEYIDGWSLSEFIDRHLILDKLPPAELVVFIVSRVCRGLQYVYERAAIVHRDISPSNIMMTREGTVKLIDFGIAARSGTRSENLVGKPSYMAPEVIASMHMDNRSDIFSLGSVFYEMLTLDRLFKADSAEATLIEVVAGVMRSPLEVNPDVPHPVLEILGKTLERRLEKRYTSAAELGAACEHWLYDKGYGPTNLTLKEYLSALFGSNPITLTLERPQFPVIELSMYPIADDGKTRRHS